MYRATSKSLLAPLAVLALLLSLGAPAFARNHGAGDSDNDNDTCNGGSSSISVPVTGTFGSGGSFTGNLTLRGFSTRNGELVALFSANGTLTGGGQNDQSVGQQVAIPIDVSTLTASCDSISIPFTGTSIAVNGQTVDLSNYTVTFNADGGSHRLRNNMCTVANMLAHNNTNLRALANVLDNVLRFS